MIRLLSTIFLLCAFQVEAALASDLLSGHASSLPLAFNSNVTNPAPAPPIFVPRDDQTVHQTNILLRMFRHDAASEVEIYRSMSETGPYQLIHVEPGVDNDFIFVDENVKPRTTFYYRARATRDGRTSEYSEIFSTTSASKFFPPILDGVIQDDFSVQLFFQDISYQDNYYTILRTNEDGSNELVIAEQLTLSDSGQTRTFTDFPDPNGTYIYYVNAEVRDEGFPTYFFVSTDTVSYPPFTPPSIAPRDDQSVQQTNLQLVIYREEAESEIEIYRSTSETGTYQIIHVEPPGPNNFVFVDENVKPRTTFYYKARAMWNGRISEFSNIFSATSASKFFPPILDGVVQDDLSVQLFFQDISYQDNNYSIFRTNEDGTNELAIVEQMILSDSGQTRTFTDFPDPNGTYIYYVNAEVKDEGFPTYFYVSTDTVHVGDLPGCTGSGSITREKWRNIAGTDIASIPVNTAPNEITELTIFETPNFDGTNYGARVRGYICVPTTGDYTFWIASDDRSELWLSGNANLANRVKIASVPGHTRPREWTKYASQKSAVITLEGGQKYYIEALHKEATGADHLAVGWQLPDGTFERPIPGMRLIDFESGNIPPIVNILTPENNQNFMSPATIDITAQAYDNDGEVTSVQFYNGSTLLGEDVNYPYSYQWNNVPPGDYLIRVVASDGFKTSEDSVNVTVAQPNCVGAGTILREVWFGIGGTSVSDIPVNTSSQYAEYLPTFETPQYYDNNYGSRIRGYLCVPASGNYTFFISSDDNSELWLSTDDDAINKVRIAFVPGHTSFRNYSKYPSQRSALIPLVGGRKYYVEALHKEANGNDHLSVAWQLPDGSTESPIPGIRLIRLGAPEASTHAASTVREQMRIVTPEVKENLNVYPNPVMNREVRFSISSTSPWIWNDADVEVISMTGSIVQKQKIKCQSDCADVLMTLKNDIQPGMYLLNVTRGRKRLVHKLLVR